MRSIQGVAVGLVGMLALCAGARSQIVYTGAPVHGVVVDADTGAPLGGVHVVARWQWLAWSSNWHESGYGPDAKRTRIMETSSTPAGRFDFAGWGPEVHVTGQMSDFDDPRLLFFKPGYEPAQFFNDTGNYTGWMDSGPGERGRHDRSTTRRSRWDGQAVKLKRFHGACTDYARLLAGFNGTGGLGIFGDDADRIPGLRSIEGSGWRTTPMTMAALELERAILGRDAASVMGSTLPQQMTFTGRVVNSSPRENMQGWILASVRWPLKAVDSARKSAAARKFVNEQGVAPVDGIVVSPWQPPGIDIPAGWQLDRDTPPKVRLYQSEATFGRLSDIAWSPTERTLAMTRLPGTPQARMQELAAWKHDIAALASDPDLLNGADFVGRGLLVDLFQKNCRELPPPLQQGLCFAADSPESQWLKERDAHVAQANEPFRNTGWGRMWTVRGWENDFIDRSMNAGPTDDCATTPNPLPPKVIDSAPVRRQERSPVPATVLPGGSFSHGHLAGQPIPVGRPVSTSAPGSAR